MLRAARRRVARSRGDDRPGAGESEEELAKKTQNPVADRISVPFQNKFNFGTGPEDRPNDTADGQLRFQLQFLFPK